MHEIFLPEECFTVMFPIIILFGLHIWAVILDIFIQKICNFKRILEINILILLIIYFWFEITRYEAMDKDKPDLQKDVLNS